MNGKLKNSANTLTLADDEDAPEWTDADFLAADLYDGEKLVRKGRPVSVSPKQSTTIRLDADVIEYFKAGGKGWQTRINNVLKEWLATHGE